MTGQLETYVSLVLGMLFFLMVLDIHNRYTAPLLADKDKTLTLEIKKEQYEFWIHSIAPITGLDHEDICTEKDGVFRCEVPRWVWDILRENTQRDRPIDEYTPVETAGGLVHTDDVKPEVKWGTEYHSAKKAEDYIGEHGRRRWYKRTGSVFPVPEDKGPVDPTDHEQVARDFYEKSLDRGDRFQKALEGHRETWRRAVEKAEGNPDVTVTFYWQYDIEIEAYDTMMRPLERHWKKEIQRETKSGITVKMTPMVT